MAAQPISLPNEPPAEISALIEARINGFNTRDNDLFLSVFGDTAIIVDGIAPGTLTRRLGDARRSSGLAEWSRTSNRTSDQAAQERATISPPPVT